MNADSGETERIGRVMSALGRLLAEDPTPWSQGLSPEGARLAMHSAAGAITAEGLRQELQTPGRRPAAVAVLVARGVFTSPLEWTCMLAAAGIAALLKPPSGEASFCEALAAAMQAEGLDVRLLPDRAIPEEATAILAFGSDQTMDRLAEDWPGRRLVLHGHRFSLALARAGADPDRVAADLALDLAHYDTRGCMAPTAIFTEGDADALCEALARAMAEAERRWPRGPQRWAADEARLRERAGLARVLGRATQGQRWSVLKLPPQRFVPAALPRVAVVHPVQTLDALGALLLPLRAHISTIGDSARSTPKTDEDPGDPAWLADTSGVSSGAPRPRVCALGTMQAPPFPRLHDGYPMLGSLLEPSGLRPRA